MNKITILILSIFSFFMLTSFTFYSIDKQPKAVQKVAKTKSKKVQKKKVQPSKIQEELTETRIEITDDYKHLMPTDAPAASFQEEVVQEVKMAQAPKSNPSKVVYFVRSKDNPNMYEEKK